MLGSSPQGVNARTLVEKSRRRAELRDNDQDCATRGGMTDAAEDRTVVEQGSRGKPHESHSGTQRQRILSSTGEGEPSDDESARNESPAAFCR